jgi:hypothetical protein
MPLGVGMVGKINNLKILNFVKKTVLILFI